MAYTKIKVSGWAFGEKLTSTQMNQLDTDHSTSIDAAALALGSTFGPVSRKSPWLPEAADRTQWSYANIANGYVENTVSTGATLAYPLRLPNGSTLTAIAFRLHPGGSHGALPATMPRFKVVSVDDSGVVTDEVAYQNDASANVAAYELIHSISVSSLSVVIANTTKTYMLQFESESGVNAQTGLKAYRPLYNYTMTNLDYD